MGAPFKSLAELDRLIHEPARLAILTALSSCRSTDFLYLQRLTGLSKGNLSSHLAKLEEAGLVAIDKGYVAKTPTTTVSLTKEGQSGIERHWKRLDRLRAAALEWQPEG
jgi:DNA-binding MarR family transcriptional regulator